MDLLSSFPKLKKGNVSFMLITDCFSKLTRAVPSERLDALQENWVLPFGFSKYLLIDNGTQFVGKLFVNLAV